LNFNEPKYQSWRCAGSEDVPPVWGEAPSSFFGPAEQHKTTETLAAV